MKFVGFPDGLKQSEEEMRGWFSRICAQRPKTEHFSVFCDGEYCGETFYSIDGAHGNVAVLDIKLFPKARGKGIATKALRYAVSQAFLNGAEKVWVDPNRKNEKALALYLRLGFSEAEVPEYLKDECTSDFLYMEMSAPEKK